MDAELTDRLVHLATRFHQEVEAPAEEDVEAERRFLATRNEADLTDHEGLLDQQAGGER